MKGLAALLGFILLGCTGGASSAQRPFLMGMTPFQYDVGTSSTSTDYTYSELATNADLIAHHFDNGVPWLEAVNDQFPYDSNVMGDWGVRAAHAVAGQKVYVAITPISNTRNA